MKIRAFNCLWFCSSLFAVNLLAAPPSAHVSGSTNLCLGSSAVIQVALTGNAPWILVWSDGYVQPGISVSPAQRTVTPQVSTSYSVNYVVDAQYVLGTNSGVAVMRVFQTPTIISQPTDAVICEGGSAMFSVSASGSAAGSAASSSIAATVGGQSAACACTNVQPFDVKNGSIPGLPGNWQGTVTYQSNALSIISYTNGSPGGAVTGVVSNGMTSMMSATKGGAGKLSSIVKGAPHAHSPDTILVKPKKQMIGPKVVHADLSGHHKKLNAKVKRSYPHMGNLQVVKLPAGMSVEEAVKSYHDSGLVEYAEPDYQVSAVLTPNDPSYGDGSLWNLAKIAAPEAWDIRTSASSIIVADIDTGICYTHPDLAANLWVNPSVGSPVNGTIYPNDLHGINAITGTGDPADDNFHGTHTAGTIGAAGNNATGVTGIAWNVQIMACKFLDANGYGSTSDAIECINYAVSKGAKVLNNSWGGGGYSQALYDAISAAGAAGVIFVAAAGNSGANNETSLFYPADYSADLDNVVAVAATYYDDRLAYFSNYGQSLVALGAPGLDIFSTLPTTQTDAMQAYGLSTNYGNLSGTSMAAPHVTGAVALTWAQYPSESYSQIIQRVLNATDPVPGLDGRMLTGGRLNLYRALSEPPSAPTWLSFQWRRNGLAIPGNVRGICVVPSPTTSNSGDVYDVIISNWCGVTTSSAASLTVNTACQIVAQPASMTQNLGGPAALSVAANGSAPITYRWRRPFDGWKQPWQLQESGPGSGSFYIGSDPAFDTSGKSFGISADNGHQMEATRYLSEPMQPGDGFSMYIDSGLVDPGGADGFVIYSVTGKKWAEICYTNGGCYFIADNAPTPGGIGGYGPAYVSFALFPNDLCFFVFASGGSPLVYVNTLSELDGDPPDHIVFYNHNAGAGPARDLYFNQFVLQEDYFINHILATDDASQSAYSDGWQNGDDGGTGPLPGATNSSFTISSLTTADAGNYEVIVKNPCGWQVSAEAVLEVTPPGVSPSNLSATAISSDLISLSWQDNSTNETGFLIERALDNAGTPGAWMQIAAVGANVTNYSDSSVSPPNTYWYRVRAYYSFGHSFYSNPAEAAVSVPPAAPSALMAGYLTSNEVWLSWTDNSTNEAGFLIERAVDNAGTPGAWMQIAVVGADITNYSDSSVSAPTYWYRLRAYNFFGDSLYSNEAEATLLPKAPSALTAAYFPGSGTRLSWTDNSTNETGYLIERALDNAGNPEAWLRIAAVGANVTNYSDSSASPSNTYWYRVRAYNSFGGSLYSNQAKAAVVPAAPSTLTASYFPGNRIRLSWTDNSTNETGFLIERSSDATHFVQIGQLLPNTTTFWDKTLWPGQTYYYRARAFNDVSDSDCSNIATERTPAFNASLTCWGNNYAGQTSTPANLSNVVNVAAGEDFSLALKNDGTVVGWGNNSLGQCSPPAGLSGVVAIAAGSSHALALKQDGTVVGWGSGYAGEASPPAGLSNVVAITARGLTSLALRNDGTVAGWGHDGYHTLDQPPGLHGVTDIAAGGDFSMALLSDGTFVTFGSDSWGALTPPNNLSRVVAIAAGNNHGVALQETGTVATWGFQAPSPAWAGVESISAGGFWTLALQTNGVLQATGDQAVYPPNMGYVIRAAAGGYHGIALTLSKPPPSRPDGLTITSVSTSLIGLSWSDVPNTDLYHIERAADSGGVPGIWVSAGVVSSNVTNFTDTG
ncbi:MAG: S8 family serine peptidase, partial [Limisphaerales bacterium]